MIPSWIKANMAKNKIFGFLLKYRNGLFAAVLSLSSFALLYHSVVVKLVLDWSRDDNYSHGFFILPIALYFVWERRVIVGGNPVGVFLLGNPVGVIPCGYPFTPDLLLFPANI